MLTFSQSSWTPRYLPYTGSTQCGEAHLWFLESLSFLLVIEEFFHHAYQLQQGYPLNLVIFKDKLYIESVKQITPFASLVTMMILGIQRDSNACHSFSYKYMYLNKVLSLLWVSDFSQKKSKSDTLSHGELCT